VAVHEIVIQQRFAAAPARVFELVTDHVGFGRWVGADIRLEHPGEPPPNGLGAVRVIHVRGLAIREEVIRFEAPHAMDYRVIGGAPFRDHLGEVRVEPDNGGARLDYRIRFAWPWFAGGALVGALLARQLEREIAGGLARMAASLGQAGAAPAR
jgi:uncharacterized protein YndB with AHSA1/START domain